MPHTENTIQDTTKIHFETSNTVMWWAGVLLGKLPSENCSCTLVMGRTLYLPDKSVEDR